MSISLKKELNSGFQIKFLKKLLCLFIIIKVSQGSSRQGGLTLKLSKNGVGKWMG
jgi:hypothetical protein